MTLTSKEFSNHNWNGRDLSNQNLSGYKLTRTQMNGANLKNSILDGVNLEYAQLSGADLTNSSLRGSNLENANLDNANLEYAQLNGANFKGANVRETRFKDCTGLSEKIKRDLKARGAIFDHDSRLIDRKWWIEKVLIPIAALLIGSGGIVGILQLSQKPVNFNSPHQPIKNTQSPAKINSN